MAPKRVSGKCVRFSSFSAYRGFQQAAVIRPYRCESDFEQTLHKSDNFPALSSPRTTYPSVPIPSDTFSGLAVSESESVVSIHCARIYSSLMSCPGNRQAITLSEPGRQSFQLRSLQTGFNISRSMQHFGFQQKAQSRQAIYMTNSESTALSIYFHAIIVPGVDLLPQTPTGHSFSPNIFLK